MNKWEKVKITDVCDIQVGKTPSRNNSSYWGENNKWLSIADMNQGNYLSLTKEFITQKAIDECRCVLIPTGTVLYSFKLSIGKVGITKVPMFTNEAIAAFIIKDRSRIIEKYLFYALKATDYSIFSNKAVLGKTLNKEKLKQFEIILPPLSEQRHIVSILDKANSLIEKRKEAIKSLDEYLVSMFLDMFGDPVTNSKKWDVKKGREYCENFSVGVVIKPASYYVDDGVIALRSLNIKENDIDLTNVVYFSEGDNRKLSKSMLRSGDVVVVRTGLTGTAAVIPDELDGINCIDLIIVRLDKDKVNPHFLSFLLNSEIGKKIISTKEVGGIQKHFNIGAIRDLSFPIPPIGLQDEFANKLIELKKLKQKMLNQSKQLEILFKTLNEITN